MNFYDFNGNLIGSLSNQGFLSEAKTKLLYTGDTGQTQGSCIDDNLNVYTAYYTLGKWLVYNLKTHEKTTYSFTANAYGHMNDLAFNPNDGYVYCASMNTTGEVYVFDPSNNMSLVDTLYARDGSGTVFGISNLAFNRKTNKFVSIIPPTQKIRIFNGSTFAYESDVSISNFYSNGTRQGIETDGEYIYHIVSPDSNNTTVVAYSYDGARETENPIVIYASTSPEFESMCYDWNNSNYIMQSANPLKLWWVGFKSVVGSDELFGAVNMIANHYLSED